jgi:antitoxin component YwqK of YwqJK toxin-antitoxin module
MDLNLFSHYDGLFAHYNQIISQLHDSRLDPNENSDVFLRTNEVGIKEAYYKNELMYMGEIKNYRRHGHGTEFYQSGGHKIHAYFKDGLVHDAEAEIYGEDGQPYIFGDIKNGSLQNGKLFKDGNLFYEGIFEEGKITTEFFKAYYTNGTLMFKGGLSKGKLNGRCKLMTADGKIRLKGFFENGDIQGDSCTMLCANNN